MSCHCLVTSMISDEKSFIILIEDPFFLLNDSFFTLTFFKIFYVFDFNQFDTDCLFIGFWVYSNWSLLSSWACRWIFGKISTFPPMFFKYSFYPFLSLLSLCLSWCTWWCLNILWGSIYFLFPFSHSAPQTGFYLLNCLQGFWSFLLST